MQDEQGTRWVVWGIGSPTPAGFFDEEVRSDAGAIVADMDDEWRESPDGWSVVVSATEDELRAWAEETPSVRGYTTYTEKPVALDEPQKVQESRPY